MSVRAIGVAAIGVAAAAWAPPAAAWDTASGAASGPGGAATLKSQIDSLLQQLDPSHGGAVQWDGSDPYEIKPEGKGESVVITNARISVHAQELAQIAIDRIEIHETPDGDNPKLSDVSFVFPKQVTLTMADGEQVTLKVEDGKASGVVDPQTGRVQQSAISFASARIEEPKVGVWINFGPLAESSKLVADAKGAWTAPVSASLKKIEFFAPQGPFSGALDEIGYSGTSAGPDIAKLDLLRDKVAGMRKDGKMTPEERATAALGLLTGIPAAFSHLEGEMVLAGLTVRVATGQPLVTLAKATIGSTLSGLDDKAAAWRITLKQDGFDLASSVLDPEKVPHRVVIDIGLEDVSTAALQTILEAAGKLASTDPQVKQAASQQMMGAAAMLTPTFRVYDLAADTKDVGFDMTVTAKGSPLSPQGYSANGDLAVRGFDAIPSLAEGVPFVDYLPLLKVLGETATGDDGAPRLKFHLASAPPKWITINGNDVSAWLISPPSKPGDPRLLKPEEPPMEGPDVVAVQRALAAADIAVDQDGAYRAATAVAVARFQKQKGLNVDGVVDAATRQKLNVKPAPAPAAPKH